MDFVLKKTYILIEYAEGDFMSNPNTNLKFKRFMSFIAFLATVLVAVALVLQVVLAAVGVEAQVISAMRLVGEIIAYVLVMLTAFMWVRTKKGVVWIVLYAVCVTAIITLLILR